MVNWMIFQGTTVHCSKHGGQSFGSFSQASECLNSMFPELQVRPEQFCSGVPCRDRDQLFLPLSRGMSRFSHDQSGDERHRPSRVVELTFCLLDQIFSPMFLYYW